MACFINLTSHKFISVHIYLLVPLQLLKVKILGILVFVFESLIAYSYSKEAILHLSSSLLVVWNRTRKECLRAWVLSCFSHVGLFVTLWTVACLAPLSMGFSRQEYWSGLPCPPPGDLPNPGIKPVSLLSLALADMFFPLVPSGKPQECLRVGKL